ncbi:type III polyketide synthase [Curtobacterium sp. ISL-83]|uniref:type III polyketide synthase n=1 Tax=Curtobacterium sp. ISL-83 TaxID=2819145 RepID=UPI001BEB0100|nr:type III polyketide synthase [Curtobacterium sp. ISL-83]MBT2501518.1 type III polyketide synthase [Curtobacterium sp. ISL-83]
MSATIRAIGTAVPRTTLAQETVRDLFREQPGLARLGQRLVGAAFDGSAVDTRHSVLPELDPAAGSGAFRDADGHLTSPSTGTRNDAYRVLAPPLFVGAARDALTRSGTAAADVTHVVTVSCTGFTQPGPDLDIVHELGLSPAVFRHHIGFMGCCAAFPALRIAAAFVEADPRAVVLVVCAELCTLHVRGSEDPDQIVANSVFGDGAAAAVVAADGAGLRLDRFTTAVVPESASEMAWNIGDEGFEMVLSTAVPKLVGASVAAAVAPLLDTGRADDVPLWAVHPGGRAILDRTQDALGLPDSAIAASRTVLREHGNMSSATVLFVLRQALDDWIAEGTPVVALAFGPGLTVECARLTAVALPGADTAEFADDVDELASGDLAGALVSEPS